MQYAYTGSVYGSDGWRGTGEEGMMKQTSEAVIKPPSLDCLYLFIYVCLHVCLSFIFASVCLCVSVCLHVCVIFSVNGRTYVRRYACMYLYV